jgi:hypothetical protein
MKKYVSFASAIAITLLVLTAEAARQGTQTPPPRPNMVLVPGQFVGRGAGQDQ